MIDTLTKKLGLNITQENFQIRAEQIRTLVKAYPSMIAANMAMAPLVVWLMWHKIEHSILLAWLALLYAFHALEIRHWLNSSKEIHNISECKRWQRQFLLSDVLVGSAWGSAGVFMFVPGEPLFQAFLLCILLGLAAGAVAGNLVFPLSQQSYVALVILPILINILQQGSREYYLLAAMIGIFLMFVMKLGRDQSKFFELSIRRGFENIELANELQRANNQLRFNEEDLRAAVSAQKEAQRQAHHSESRYKTLIEQAANALFVFDFNGRFIEVNQQACDSLGYTTHELLQLSVADIVPGFDLASRRPSWEKLEFGNPYSMISTHRCKDGRIFPVEVRIVLLEVNNELMLMALAIDITERVRAEEQLRNSYLQLEEKELAKTRFLAAAGHDLRQPVAAANLFVDALKLTSPTQQQKEMIEKLDQSMSIFSGLLERLLDISKFDAGLVKTHFTPYNLSELFNWLNQNFSQEAYGKNLRFKFFFPMNKSLIIRTDIGLLQSVLMNLASNAIKFTSHGGILISARQRGEEVLIQVWDTGLGIAETEIIHIFDEFYQVANPQRSREGGLGLGLSICQRATALLEGKITCRSRLGQGSVFELRLPYDGELQGIEPLPINSTAAEVANEILLKGKRVVVLEDDELVASGMVNLLRGLYAEVLHFHNAEEALQHPDITHADYFIVDYALDGEITGLKFLETLQKHQNKLLNAVILTGETSSKFISSVENCSWTVLHKPVHYAKLLSSLNSSAETETSL